MNDLDPTTIAYVLDEEGLHDLLIAIASADLVVYDLETSGLNAYAPGASITLSSFTLPRSQRPGEEPETWVLPLAHPESPFAQGWQKVAREVFAEVAASQQPIVGHNVKFDVRWVHAHTGVDLSRLIEWDSQVIAHLQDENRSTRLKEVAPATFGIERWDDVDLKGDHAADRVPYFDLALYAARDTYWTWRLYDRQRSALGVGPDEHLDPTIPEEREGLRLGRLTTRLVVPMVRTLTAIEQRGFHLDVARTEEVLDTMNRSAAEARARLGDSDPELRDRAAAENIEESYEPTARWFRTFTERAVDEGRLRVVELTPNGRPSWGKATLRRLDRLGYPVARDILSYRHATKRAQYLRSWLEHLGPDGRVHANYNVGSVVTGRLSSSEPNMQQVSGDLKPCWTGGPGTVIAEIDYSQIELRAAAYVARCEPMLQAFREGRDLHRIMAASVARKREEDVTPDERQRAKAVNFGFLYGMGSLGFQTYADETYGAVFTEEEAELARAAFFDTWQGLSTWHRAIVREAQHHGEVVSPIGRFRRLPAIHDGNDRTRGSAERQAINSPIQSLASDLMQLAAARIEGTISGSSPLLNVRIVATVHDSIVVEVPEDDWKRTVARAMRAMLDLTEPLAGLDCRLDVPLEVEAKIGSRWGDPFAVIAS